MARFALKRTNKITPRVKEYEYTNTIIIENKEKQNVTDMTTLEKIAQASEILSAADAVPTKVKRTKSDKGLIERTESSTIVLTEDNKELLQD